MDIGSLDNVETLIEAAMTWGVKVGAGVVTFVIGMVAARLARRTMVGLLRRARLDPVLSKVIGNLVYYMLLSVVGIAVFGILGIQTASLITILGAAHSGASRDLPPIVVRRVGTPRFVTFGAIQLRAGRSRYSTL